MRNVRSDITKKFAENLKKVRLEKKLTQIEMAELIGTKQVTYCFYETGQRFPNLDILENIVEKCGTSISYLFGENEMMYVNNRDTTVVQINDEVGGKIGEMILPKQIDPSSNFDEMNLLGKFNQIIEDESKNIHIGDVLIYNVTKNSNNEKKYELKYVFHKFKD